MQFDAARNQQVKQSVQATAGIKTVTSDNVFFLCNPNCFWKMISISDRILLLLKSCYPYPKTIQKCITFLCGVYFTS